MKRGSKKGKVTLPDAVAWVVRMAESECEDLRACATDARGLREHREALAALRRAEPVVMASVDLLGATCLLLTAIRKDVGCPFCAEVSWSGKGHGCLVGLTAERAVNGLKGVL